MKNRDIFNFRATVVFFVVCLITLGMCNYVIISDVKIDVDHRFNTL
jgi:hypothetical protein